MPLNYDKNSRPDADLRSSFLHAYVAESIRKSRVRCLDDEHKQLIKDNVSVAIILHAGLHLKAQRAWICSFMSATRIHILR